MSDREFLAALAAAPLEDQLQFLNRLEEILATQVGGRYAGLVRAAMHGLHETVAKAARNGPDPRSLRMPPDTPVPPVPPAA